MQNELKQFFRSNSILFRLIAVNLAVFLVINIFRLFLFLFDLTDYLDTVTGFLGVSSNLNILAQRPWTIVTYAFLHLGIFHFVFNMIMLFVGGKLFSDFIGHKQLIATYFLGGLVGAVFFVGAFNAFPVFEDIKFDALAIGASASVLSIFIAVAVYAPNFKIPLLLIGPVKLKYIAIFIVVVDIISISRGNPGGHIAHLGGAFWGFIYATLLQKRIDPAKTLGRWFSSLGNLFQGKPRMRAKYTSSRPISDFEYNANRAEKQKEIDRILDKISQSGYDSLSATEKEILFKSS